MGFASRAQQLPSARWTTLQVVSVDKVPSDLRNPALTYRSNSQTKLSGRSAIKLSRKVTPPVSISAIHSHPSRMVAGRDCFMITIRATLPARRAINPTRRMASRISLIDTPPFQEMLLPPFCKRRSPSTPGHRNLTSFASVTRMSSFTGFCSQASHRLGHPEDDRIRAPSSGLARRRLADRRRSRSHSAAPTLGGAVK